MTLWWLQPGWASRSCSGCGVNIRASGGDPDHGVCYDCFMAQQDWRRDPEPQGPLCEICGKFEACSGANGFGVCSFGCAEEAETRGDP